MQKRFNHMKNTDDYEKSNELNINRSRKNQKSKKHGRG